MDAFHSKGAVWKAIVDHKLMRAANEHFGSDYYQKLLSNCSVTKNLSSAAKQVNSMQRRNVSNNWLNFNIFLEAD